MRKDERPRQDNLPPGMAEAGSDRRKERPTDEDSIATSPPSSPAGRRPAAWACMRTIETSRVRLFAMRWLASATGSLMGRSDMSEDLRMASMMGPPFAITLCLSEAPVNYIL